MTTDRRDRTRGARIVCAAALCIAFVAAAVGCGTSPKRHIAFSKKPSRQSNSRYVVRGQSHKQPPGAHQGMFIWPLDDFTFMSPFGIRRGRRHDGVDLSAKGGTPVHAAADGEVVFSKRMRGYGNLILIKHDHDYFTAYAHNSANIADKGKKVKQGDKIALVGRTGRATGNHVHFEIRKGQQAMDPLNFLPARAGVLVKKEGAKKTTVAAKTSTKSKAKTETTSKTTVAKKSTTKVEAKTKVTTTSKATVATKNPTKVKTATKVEATSKATVAKKTAKPATKATVAEKTAAPKTASSKSMTPKAAKIKDSVAQLQKKPANAPKTTVAKSPEISSKKASPNDTKPAVEKNEGPKVAKKSGKAMSNK